MAYNNIPVYKPAVTNNGATCGGFGVYLAAPPSAGVTLPGPYFAGTFYIDTGVNAPSGDGANITSAADAYQGRCWGRYVTVDNVTGMTSGVTETCKVHIDCVPIFRRQLQYATWSSGASGDRIYLKCDAYFSDVYVKQTAYDVYCSHRLDNVDWALWRV